MEFSYGQGVYREGERVFRGQIILGQHKLYLKNDAGELPPTFIPMEKIERIRLTSHGAEIHARPSLSYQYQVTISGEPPFIKNLVKDIALRRGFKKKFLKSEWVERDI
jgi:hypothetical protein